MSDVNQYDAGVDQWNKVYKELKDGLLKKYGNAGPSPRTGNAMPKVPWANAVVISIQFATWLTEALIEYGARVHRVQQPLIKVIRKPADVPYPMEARVNEGSPWAPTQSGFIRTAAYFNEHDSQSSIAAYLNGQVVDTGYLLIPHPIRDVMYQRNLDPTNRLVEGPYIVGINRDGGLHMEPAAVADVQWFGTGVREYTRLIYLPAECTGITAMGRGPFGNLDAVAADMFLSRIYAATQTLAVRIPDVTYMEAVERMIDITAEAAAVVVNTAAKAAGGAASWAAQQAAGAANTFLGELNFYGWIAVIGAGVYILR